VEPVSQPKLQPVPARSAVAHSIAKAQAQPAPAPARVSQTKTVVAVAPVQTPAQSSAPAEPVGALIFTGEKKSAQKQSAQAGVTSQSGGKRLVWLGVGILVTGLVSLACPPIRARIWGMVAGFER